MGSIFTAGFVLVLILNLVLWLDLNYMLYKRGKTEDNNQQQRKGLLEEIVEEITDPLYIIIVSFFSWAAEGAR